MYTAKEANEYSTERLKQIKSFTSPAEYLYKHLEEKIRDQVEKGCFEAKNIIFPVDRFKSEAIEYSTKKLKSLGFKVDVDNNNAYQKIMFNITW